MRLGGVIVDLVSNRSRSCYADRTALLLAHHHYMWGVGACRKNMIIS